MLSPVTQRNFYCKATKQNRLTCRDNSCYRLFSHCSRLSEIFIIKKSDAISSTRPFIRESRTLSNNFDPRCLTSPTVLSATTRGGMIMDHYPSVHEFKQKIFLLAIRSTSLLSVEKPFTNCYKIGSLFDWNFYEKNLVVCLRRNTYTGQYQISFSMV